jgi:aryl-alcohol dehydrogenase-like predicted oxidoreductase
MNYRLLGNSGLRVSELSLGTMTFGEDWGWGAAKDEARKIYDYYREQGGNFIDTANVYTNGSSERIVGEFVQGHRSEMVIATKYTNDVGALAGQYPGPNAGGNHRKSMMSAVEASLKRLGTDYIDLYWLHIWDKLTPVDEVMRAFDDLVMQGKILYAGVSDAPAWWVAQANTLAQFHGWTRFAALQIEYSLVERTVERELIPMAHAFNLALLAWSPLAGGLLSGKYKQGGKTGGRYDDEAIRGFMSKADTVDAVIGALEEISRESGRSLAQVALAWLRYREIPVIPIIGARKFSQFEDNVASLTLELTPQQVDRLNKASAIPLGFPHDFYENPMVKAMVYGGHPERIQR